LIMTGRLKDYMRIGNIADLPLPATQDALIQVDSIAWFFAKDTVQWFTFDKSIPDWVEFNPGAQDFADLADVDWTTPPTDGQVFVWDAGASKLVPADFPTPGAGAFQDLTDVDWTTPPTDGQVFVWNAGTSKLVPVDMGGGSGVPAGGTTYQVLTKLSDTDGDADWENPAAYGDRGFPWDEADYTFVQGTGGSTTQLDTDTILFTQTGTSTQQPHGIWTEAVPATPYSYERRLSIENIINNFQGGGLILWDSVGGKGLTFQLRYNSYSGGLGYNMSVVRITAGSGTENAPLGGGGTINTVPFPGFMRIRDDGTDIFFEYSRGGNVWLTLYTEARAAYLTSGGDQIGICLFPWYESGSARDAKVVFRTMPMPEPVAVGTQFENPTIVGSDDGNGTGGTFNVTLPGSAAAGDICYIFAGQGNGPVPTAGHDFLAMRLGTGTNTMLSKRVLDATDISNGYVTTTWTGGFNGSGCCIVFDPDDLVIDLLTAEYYGSGYRASIFGGKPWVSKPIPRKGILLTWLYSRQNTVITSDTGTIENQYNGGGASHALFSHEVDADDQLTQVIDVPANDYDTHIYQFLVSKRP
jgi:hypothetical protein